MKLWDLRLFSEQDGLEEARRAVKEQHWDYRYERPRLAKVGGSFSILSPYRYRYFFVGSGAATGVAKGWRGGGGGGLRAQFILWHSTASAYIPSRDENIKYKAYFLYELKFSARAGFVEFVADPDPAF